MVMKRNHEQLGRGTGARCKQQRFKPAARKLSSSQSGMLPACPCLRRVPCLLPWDSEKNNTDRGQEFSKGDESL